MASVESLGLESDIQVYWLNSEYWESREDLQHVQNVWMKCILTI